MRFQKIVSAITRIRCSHNIFSCLKWSSGTVCKGIILRWNRMIWQVSVSNKAAMGVIRNEATIQSEANFSDPVIEKLELERRKFCYTDSEEIVGRQFFHARDNRQIHCIKANKYDKILVTDAQSCCCGYCLCGGKENFFQHRIQ